MSTRIDVTLPADAIHYADQVFAIFGEVESMASEWRPDAALARINAGGGAPVPAPAELRALLGRGVALGALTDGAFDVTWAALWGVWDFDAPVIPDPEEVASRTAWIDYRAVWIDDDAGTVALGHPARRLGLGGVAKGWALDRSADCLRDARVDAFALSAGGQVLVEGSRGDRPWRVGVRDPRGPAREAFATLTLSHGSVATTADDEQYFERDGLRYHHILDPRSGWPARGLRSVTVWARDGTTADGLSTALMVLGLERGRTLVESLDGVEALWIDDRGGLHHTVGLAPEIHRRPHP